MKTLLVLAHPEPASFTSALARTAIETLTRAEHEVRVSDLYVMRFDPVSDRRNFCGVFDPDRLDQQAEERFAASHDGFRPELQAEMDKLLWCDTLILQFPLWWMGMPAILKGWIDRVFAVGRVYGGGRWFDHGMLSGRRAMLAVTIGGSAGAYSHDGAYGPIDAILHPIHHGILAFVGFSVIAPFTAFAPGRSTPVEREEMLDDYRRRLLALETMPLLPMPRSDDYPGLVRRQNG